MTDELDRYKNFGHPMFRRSYDLFDRMDKFMQGFFGESLLQPTDYKLANKVWKKEDKQYIGTIDLPGMKKEEIQIKTTDRGLEIIAEQEKSNEDNGKEYRKYYSYQSLPKDSNLEKINAAYNNGVLTVTVPRLENKKKESLEIKVN